MIHSTIEAPVVPETNRSTPDYPARRRKLLQAAGADEGSSRVVLLSSPKDIRYFTGVHEGASWLAVSRDWTLVVTRALMLHEVKEVASDCDVMLPSRHSTDRVDIERFVANEVKRRGASGVVVEPARMVAASYISLSAHAAELRLEILHETGLTESLRAIKDAGELALIRRCAEIADEAFRELVAGGASSLIGRTERELAAELERNMIALGADRQGFPETGIIVASGPNGANAHHRPSHRRVSSGEGLLIDWGAEVSGYRSDMTRTIFIDTVPAFAREAYPVVESALLSAAALLRAGASMGEVDRMARETVLQAGLPEFHYGVGHGVGLDIHEGPWLRAHSEQLLAADMVTTIEPGIYIPGTGGIRIEDLFHVLPTGFVPLGKLPTSLDAMIVC